MNKAEILAFLNKNQICYLATVDDKTPRVRGMMPYRTDDKGMLFHTGRMKDLYKQLQTNPKVELCFNDLENYVQVRVNGTVEFVEDQSLKEEIVEQRPFLKPWVDAQGYDILVVFRVTGCVATVWTMATNFAPKEYIKL